jgi:hypothetical protein
MRNRKAWGQPVGNHAQRGQGLRLGYSRAGIEESRLAQADHQIHRGPSRAKRVRGNLFGERRRQIAPDAVEIFLHLRGVRKLLRSSPRRWSRLRRVLPRWPADCGIREDAHGTEGGVDRLRQPAPAFSVGSRAKA